MLRNSQPKLKVLGHLYDHLLNLISSITAPQDAHKRLVLQVYLGSITFEFSAICSENIC